MLKSIKMCMTRNKQLARYDFRNNDLRDDGKYFYIYICLTFNFYSIAVIFFTEMLGTEEEGKISHVTEIEISERSTGKKQIEGEDPPKFESFIKLFKD